MNLSSPFIHRPVATTLLALAVLLAGAVAYWQLPVAPLPRVDFPTISVSASLPGASPETMASAVATPLERRLGRIAGVNEMTSNSSLGQTSVTLQFDLSRDIAAASRDVQAGINAALGELPALGQIFAGPKGEGVVGITFRIAGPLSQPQVMVNPLSLILPGAFRGLGEMAPASYRIVPRQKKVSEPRNVKLPQAPAGGEAVRQPTGKAPRVVTPELSGGWSTNTSGAKKQ